MKKTKIVCTIGPASEDREIFKQLVLNGLNVARLNFSHGNHEEHLNRIEMIQSVREELDVPVAILLDTKGPEIRTGKFHEPVELKEGQEFTLTTEDFVGTKDKCQISYKGLPEDVVAGDRILIDDGLVELIVKEIKGSEIVTTVNNSGVIKDNKGINVPGVKINLPAITQKDESDILFGVDNDIDFIAASFVRKPEDVLEIRKLLEREGESDVHIISKIENQEGLDNLEEILNVSDGIMVARGDLGVEIPTEEVPLAQKKMIKLCNIAGKPVITATQMLDSMQRNPRPTRAEVTDVANAILDGTDAIMLSGETAAGKYPIESVKTMSSIAKNIEGSIDYKELLNKKSKDLVEEGVTFAVSHATCNTAYDLDANAIITATSSGFTARKVSQFRPKSNVIATTTYEKVRRKLSLVWGVESLIVPSVNSTDEIFEISVSKCKEHNLIKKDDLVIITAGVPIGLTGATNLIKVHVVGELILKGLGLGNKIVTGRACVINSFEDTKNFKDGDIIVTSSTDKELVPFIERSAGMVLQDGGYTSHGAIVAINLKKPSVVGVYENFEFIKNDTIITVDPIKGIVYEGRTRVI